ncbi:MAG: ATP-binding protein [Acidobacteriota bacterium]
MADIIEKRDLFSLDVDAFLKKTASFTQRSDLLYPVELTKTSLKRGANKVRVIINRSMVKISDNGEGISSGHLKMLADLFDPSKSVEVRENAIRTLKEGHGAGLLSIFAPLSRQIIIENGNLNGKNRMIFKKGELKTDIISNVDKGTRITIIRRANDFKKEISLFNEYCKWSEEEIFLNGQKVKRDKALPDSMVSLKVAVRGGEIKGWCGVPREGDICKAWFLENGIIWKRFELPPVKGFLFHIVLECKCEFDEGIVDELVPWLNKLYMFLASKYSRLGNVNRERVEKLLFFHFSETGNREFIDKFKPFKIFLSGDELGLQEVEKLAYSGKLFCVGPTSDKNNSSFFDKSSFIIELTSRQIDFLANNLSIPLKFFNPARMKYGVKDRLKLFFLNLRTKIAKVFPSFAGKEIDQDELWNEEKLIINRINSWLAGDGKKELYTFGFSKAEIILVKGKGFSPVALKKHELGITGNKLYIYLRRSNPLVKKMIKMAGKDHNNIEIILGFIRTEISNRFAISKKN